MSARVNRARATVLLAERLAGEVVVSNLGQATLDLQHRADRHLNCYTFGSMGQCSSIALGIALGRPDVRVICLDGDGSLLMNLGSLTTLARHRPANLIHLVFDNEVLLSVGRSFTTATATGSDLAAMAAGAGISRTGTYRTEEELRRAFLDALAARELAVLVAKVEPQGPPSYFIDLHFLESRFQFQRHLRGLAAQGDQR